MNIETSALTLRRCPSGTDSVWETVTDEPFDTSNKYPATTLVIVLSE